MKVRLLADADLNRAIVSGVLRRDASVDFLSAQAAGLRDMNDLEVLASRVQAALRSKGSNCCRMKFISAGSGFMSLFSPASVDTVEYT